MSFLFRASTPRQHKSALHFAPPRQLAEIVAIQQRGINSEKLSFNAIAKRRGFCETYRRLSHGGIAIAPSLRRVFAEFSQRGRAFGETPKITSIREGDRAPTGERDFSSVKFARISTRAKDFEKNTGTCLRCLAVLDRHTSLRYI